MATVQDPLKKNILGQPDRTIMPVGGATPVKNNLLGYTPSTGVAQKSTATGYNAATADAAKYDANQREVKGNATVSGQLDELLKTDNPYLKRATIAADQQSNARGFLNSSMAIGNAQGALIDRALPIAQQDASTYDLRDRTNMDAQNQASQFNAGNQQQVNLANMGAKNDASQFGANAQNQSSQFNASQQNAMTETNMNAKNRASEFGIETAQRERMDQAQKAHEIVMQNLDTVSKERLIGVEMEYKRDIESDKNASNVYMQSMDAMSQALGNSALSAEQQNRAVTEITGQLGAFLDFNRMLNDPNFIPKPTNAGSTVIPGTDQTGATQPTGATTSVQPPATATETPAQKAMLLFRRNINDLTPAQRVIMNSRA